MDSGITSGLIGGLVAAIISTLIIKSAQRKITHGELKHGVFILVLAMVCMTIALFAAWSFIYDDDVHEKAGELEAIIGLFSGFSVFSFVFFAEYFKARGQFNDNGIEFQTPWTGTKKKIGMTLFQRSLTRQCTGTRSNLNLAIRSAYLLVCSGMGRF
ncbi:hypothetical protein [Vibrio coralliilyticus]|uniref:hypothetical protein n=1 Tax=Vibrio coralliilyticus TaxID=190893 RepID=UPI00030FFE55|nr:hypothetical protein [Vibrio coralliilyticus]